MAAPCLSELDPAPSDGGARVAEVATAVVILSVALVVAVVLAVRGAVRSRNLSRRLAEVTESTDSLADQLAAVRSTATDRVAELEAQTSTVADERDGFRARLGEVQAERDRLQASVDESFVELTNATDELVKRDADLLHARAAVFEAETAAAAAMGRAGESRAELEKALEELHSLRNELSDSRAAEGLAPDESRPEPSPLVVEALWALERARVERTWRQSVAADPSDPGPFQSDADPARTAVEVEVAAIREEVGSDLTAEWRIDAHLAIGDGLLVVRAAQELLATASRSLEQGVLIIERDESSVRLSIVGPDGSPIVIGGLVDLSVVPGSHVDESALVVPLSN